MSTMVKTLENKEMYGFIASKAVNYFLGRVNDSYSRDKIFKDLLWLSDKKALVDIAMFIYGFKTVSLHLLDGINPIASAVLIEDKISDSDKDDLIDDDTKNKRIFASHLVSIINKNVLFSDNYYQYQSYRKLNSSQRLKWIELNNKSLDVVDDIFLHSLFSDILKDDEMLFYFKEKYCFDCIAPMFNLTGDNITYRGSSFELNLQTRLKLMNLMAPLDKVDRIVEVMLLKDWKNLFNGSQNKSRSAKNLVTALNITPHEKFARSLNVELKSLKYHGNQDYIKLVESCLKVVSENSNLKNILTEVKEQDCEDFEITEHSYEVISLSMNVYSLQKFGRNYDVKISDELGYQRGFARAFSRLQDLEFLNQLVDVKTSQNNEGVNIVVSFKYVPNERYSRDFTKDVCRKMIQEIFLSDFRLDEKQGSAILQEMLMTKDVENLPVAKKGKVVKM